MTPAPNGTAFDAAARTYDSVFTRTRLGRFLRARVWSRLEHTFRPGMRVLELGCGTGEDALWLARRGLRVVATDSSEAMLEVAREKIAAAGLSGRVSFARLDLGDPSRAPDLLAAAEGRAARDSPAFDGVLSDFGGMNCVPDRAAVAAFLARVLRPGGRAVLVVMGPWCPWEIAWYGLHRDWRTATRRFRADGLTAEVEGRLVRVWYPSPGRLRREFAPWFRPRGLRGVGTFLPPPYLRRLVEDRPLFGVLARLETSAAALWPLSLLSDHYLIELERRASDSRRRKRVRNP